MTDRENSGRRPNHDSIESDQETDTPRHDTITSSADSASSRTEPSASSTASTGSATDGTNHDATNHDTTIEFRYDSAVVADIVAESVTREVGEIDDDRSRTTLSREEAAVSIEIAARDLTALRAGTNTWFSLVDVAERTARIGRAVQPGSDPAGSQRS